MSCQVVAVHRPQVDNLLGRDVTLHRFDPDHASLGPLRSVTLKGRRTENSITTVSSGPVPDARTSERERAWVQAACKEVLSAIISLTKLISLTLFSFFAVH